MLELWRRCSARTHNERMVYQMKKDSNFTILAHTDYLIDVAERRSRGETHVLERRHYPVLKEGGVNVICDHVGGGTNMFSLFPLSKIVTNADPLERSLSGIDYMRSEARESSERISIITQYSDFDQVVGEENLGIVLCLQGGSPIRQDLALLRTFYRLGIRCLHLTANRRNQISDSCMGRTTGGLTEFGVSVVEEMNRIGMVIDISQLSPKGCHDVLELSSDPVIASNSNAKSRCGHPRNLEDEVIEKVGSNGGVICIHCLPSFLVDSGQASVEDMVRHIEYIDDLVGIEHVGVGPDLLENWPEEQHAVIWESGQDLGHKKIQFDYPDGFQSIADMPNLRKSLLENGYSEEDLTKIMGNNLLRVFRHVWK